ncbi:MAG TPA: hypothetical protein VNJ54_04030 [Plantibacter sp.]|uniref:hypothetical protein n=1 Tax=unclassified Plantibacter TaxID=2624265 RepID=UPI002C212974|nr:hypothetical protein [Plantibacter sp.]
MNREQLKSLGVAAAGRGNALFLDEHHEAGPDAVVFAPRADVFTVYATDRTATPIERTRRSFGTDAAAFDYMYECLKERADTRRGPGLIASYRRIGVRGVASALVWIATAVGWLWISPFTYTADDMRKWTADSDRLGSFIFPAETGLPVVAVCYSLAAITMVVQWSQVRRGAVSSRRALGTAAGTALFATIALVCMVIRAGEIEDLFFWFPPVLALAGAAAVVLAAAQARSRETA